MRIDFRNNPLPQKARQDDSHNSRVFLEATTRLMQSTLSLRIMGLSWWTASEMFKELSPLQCPKRCGPEQCSWTMSSHDGTTGLVLCGFENSCSTLYKLELSRDPVLIHSGFESLITPSRKSNSVCGSTLTTRFRQYPDDHPKRSSKSCLSRYNDM